MEDSSYARVVGFSAGSWNDISTPEMHAGWSDNKVTEISIPLSDIGNPDMDLIAWGQWQRCRKRLGSIPNEQFILTV